MNRSIASIAADVVVAGGGAAGVAAALAAARNGADTLLIENNGYLGGISASLAWLGFHDNKYRLLCKGLASEFVDELARMGEASRYVFDPKCSSAVSLNPHAWKILAMRLCRQAGVRLMLQTRVVDTLREGDCITGVVVEHKSGRQEIHSKIAIDCSGDGDVAAMGGARWEKGRTRDGMVQAPTLVFRIGGINRPGFIDACKDKSLGYREWLLPYPDLWDKMMRRIDTEPLVITGGFAGLIEKARQNGDFDVPQSRLVGVKTHVPDEYLVVSTRVLGLDPIDVGSMTEAYARVYEQVPIILNFFRKYLPGCESAQLREIAPMMGVRESRRIVGDYMLTQEDLVEGRVFDDAVCMGGYHIDIHRPSGTWVESRNVDAYTIPLRCLIACDVEGLMMAGKCLSATHEAVASTRVIPICIGQGQAAGTAAALAVRKGVGVRSVPVGELQEALEKQGAEIGRTLQPANERLIDQIGVLPPNEPESTGEDDAATKVASAWIR
jgi:FAD dependent oxidoreductase